jgi:hypothetical protein
MVKVDENHTHFLLTRYNVRAFKSVKRPSKLWLDHRFDIFSNLCLPSVAAQSSQSFSWLVFFDAGTPAPYLRQIGELRKRYPFEICLVDNFTAAIAALAVTSRSKASKRVITTRLDNDDAICNTFVEVVQRAVSPTLNCWVNIDRGYRLSQLGLQHAFNNSNPFLSLVESTEGCRTVMCQPHNLVYLREPVLHIPIQRGWIQYVHERNIKNDLQQGAEFIGPGKYKWRLANFASEVCSYAKRQRPSINDE